MAAPQVGIIADERPSKTIQAAVTDSGAQLQVGQPESLPGELACLIVPSEQALRSAIDQGRTGPLLPVSPIDGLPSVSLSVLTDALSAILQGDAVEEQHPVLGVTVDEVTDLAFRDIGLITDAPAKINEYRVGVPADDIQTQFRADGVVIATPAGSHGYAGAAGAPQLGPTAGFAIVPVAPFMIDIDRWVVADVPIEVTVCRDESPVAVEIDGTERGTVYTGETVEITQRDTITVIRTPHSTLPGAEE